MLKLPEVCLTDQKRLLVTSFPLFADLTKIIVWSLNYT